MFLKFTEQWLLNSFVFLLLKGLAIKQDYSRQGQEKKEERKVLSGSVKCRSSVVAKKLGSRLTIKLRRLKEGSKCLMLSVEVPVVLYQAITGQKSSR